MQPFTERVVRIIQGIPPGRVMAYGQIAALAGNSRGARQVVRILHSMSESQQLPWHRVVNAQGKIAIPDEVGKSFQQQLLEQEDVEFEYDGRVDLAIYRHEPLPPFEET